MKKTTKVLMKKVKEHTNKCRHFMFMDRKETQYFEDVYSFQIDL